MRQLVYGLIAAAFLVVAPSAAFADDEGPNWTFGASTSYVYDINSPNNGGPNAVPPGAGGTSGFNSLSYANIEPRDEAFNIDLIQLGISGSRGAASYGATIDFGDLSALADNSSDGDIALQTGWLGYDMDMIGITAGRFGTPIGYEVLEPWGNNYISRSYNWQLQPINHDGATVHATLDMFEIMAGVVNQFTVGQSDRTPTINDSDNRKGIIWAIGGSFSDAFNTHFAGIYSDDFGKTTKVLELNGIISGDIDAGGTGVRYAVENTYMDQDFDSGGGSTWAHAVSVNVGVDLGPTGIDARYEYMNDNGLIVPSGGLGLPGAGGKNGSKTNSFTLDLTWALVDGMDFRVEYRHDNANNQIYGDGSKADDSDNIVQAQLIWYPEL